MSEPNQSRADAPAVNSLNREQIAILHHTEHVAAGGYYCGGGKDMDRLVELGLMQSVGFKGFCPDEFFGITSAGRAALRRERALPMSAAVKYEVAPVRLENGHYERCQPGEATEWGLYKVMPDGTSAHVHDYPTKEEADAAATCFPRAADSVKARCAECATMLESDDAFDVPNIEGCQEVVGAGGHLPGCSKGADSVKHTPEPWRVYRESAIDYRPFEITDGKSRIALLYGGGPTRAIDVGEEGANARRIVACVNGCAGLNPEAVRPLLEALKRALAAHSIGRTLTVGEWTEARAAIALAERREP